MDKKIKICALTTISKTMDWFIVDSMRNLAENGYDITLVCNMDKDFISKNSDYAKCVPLQMSRGTSVSDLIKSILWLTKFFKKEKFDMIYYTTPNASFYSSIAGVLSGTKTRVYNQCGLRYVSFSGIKRLIFKTIEKATCLLSTHIRAKSFKNMDFAIEEKLCPKNKVSVVGIGGTIGVSLSDCRSFNHKQAKSELRAKYEIPENAFVYGYVGRINADKGLNELITAFSEISKKIPNAYLVMVGMVDDTNPITDKNMDIAKSSKNIIMTGNVPKETVYKHMAMFDVLVHPTYREGFGMVLQEAMGVEIPIITTDVPGPSEVIENNISGILCQAQDPKDLQNKMELLFENPELRENFVKAGKERAEKYFDRPIMLKNILTDMNEIINGNRK